MRDKQLREDVFLIQKIGEFLDNVTPEARVAVLEYCLFVANKDLEG